VLNRHDIAEILLKVALKHQISNQSFSVESPWYSWNIAESGIKTPNIKSNQSFSVDVMCYGALKSNIDQHNCLKNWLLDFQNVCIITCIAQSNIHVCNFTHSISTLQTDTITISCKYCISFIFLHVHHECVKWTNHFTVKWQSIQVNRYKLT
jgi:hypothetical protein